MPLPEKETAPVEKWADLRQAVQWIAFDSPPIPLAYDVAYGYPTRLEDYVLDDEARKVSKAKSHLFLALHERRLIAQGCQGDPSAGGQVNTDQNGNPVCWQSNEYASDQTDIPPSFWDFHCIEWTESYAWQWTGYRADIHPIHGEYEMPENGTDYIDIRIKTKDLRKVFPAETILTQPTPSRPLSPNIAYTTPCLDLMGEAIRHFGPNGFTTEKKVTIVHWLQQHKIGDEKLSKHLAEVMATILRPPEMKKGRAARRKKR